MTAGIPSGYPSSVARLRLQQPSNKHRALNDRHIIRATVLQYLIRCAFILPGLDISFKGKVVLSLPLKSIKKFMRLIKGPSNWHSAAFERKLQKMATMTLVFVFFSEKVNEQ